VPIFATRYGEGNCKNADGTLGKQTESCCDGKTQCSTRSRSPGALRSHNRLPVILRRQGYPFQSVEFLGSSCLRWMRSISCVTVHWYDIFILHFTSPSTSENELVRRRLQLSKSLRFKGKGVNQTTTPTAREIPPSPGPPRVRARTHTRTHTHKHPKQPNHHLYQSISRLLSLVNSLILTTITPAPYDATPTQNSTRKSDGDDWVAICQSQILAVSVRPSGGQGHTVWRVADEEDETGDLLGTGCGMLQSSSCGSGPLGERRRGWCEGREGISWSKCSAKRDWRDIIGVVRGGWGGVRLEG